MLQAVRNSAYLALSSQLVLSTGYAQERAHNQPDPVGISTEVVVTATRYEERVASVPANVSVITSQDILNSTAQDIPSLLRNVAGVHVIDVGGNQRSYRVDLRGFGESAAANTLILVDGRRVNQADLSGTDWFQIPLSRVEKIEIVRGGRGAVLYGDNASAGVINIVTKSGNTLTAGGEVRAGNYKTFRSDGGLEGSLDGLAYALGADYFRTDGYRDNSAVSGGDLGGNLNLPLSDSLAIEFSGGYHSDQAGLPGALKESDFDNGASRTDSLYPDDLSDVDDYYILIRPKYSFLGTSWAQMDFSFRKRGSLFFSSFSGGTFQGNTDINTYTVAPQLVLKEPLGGFPNSFTAGFDFAKSTEDVTNRTDFFGTTSVGLFDLEKENSSFFLHDEVFPVENLALSGGYRHDRVTYSFSPSTPISKKYDLNVYTIGANYHLLTESHFYLSFSRSFRYPLLDELFDFFSNTINAGLRPQTSDDFELGLRHYFTQSVYCNVNFFRIETKDEIFFNPEGGPFGFGANENFDAATRRAGIELAAGSNIGILTLQGSYTYTSAKVRGGQFQDNWVPSVPANKFGVNSTIYLTSGVTVVVDGSYIGVRHFESDWAGRFGNQDDYFLLNSRISYNWKNYRVYVDINNLLNQEYSEYGVTGGFPVERAFYPSPKANFLAGFSVRF